MIIITGTVTMMMMMIITLMMMLMMMVIMKAIMMMMLFKSQQRSTTPKTKVHIPKYPILKSNYQTTTKKQHYDYASSFSKSPRMKPFI